MDNPKGKVYGTPFNDQHGRTVYVSRLGSDVACNICTTSPFPDDKTDYLALRLDRKGAEGLVKRLQDFLADTSPEKARESIDGKVAGSGTKAERTETGKSPELKWFTSSD